MAAAVQYSLDQETYYPSRGPGTPLYEFLCILLIPAGGYWLTNLAGLAYTPLILTKLYGWQAGQGWFEMIFGEGESYRPFLLGGTWLSHAMVFTVRYLKCWGYFPLFVLAVWAIVRLCRKGKSALTGLKVDPALAAVILVFTLLFMIAPFDGMFMLPALPAGIILLLKNVPRKWAWALLVAVAAHNVVDIDWGSAYAGISFSPRLTVAGTLADFRWRRHMARGLDRIQTRDYPDHTVIVPYRGELFAQIIMYYPPLSFAGVETDKPRVRFEWTKKLFNPPVKIVGKDVYLIQWISELDYYQKKGYKLAFINHDRFKIVPWSKKPKHVDEVNDLLGHYDSGMLPY